MGWSWDLKMLVASPNLAMGTIDKKAMSENTKRNLWWRYRNDIFDLWTIGPLQLSRHVTYFS